MLFRYIILCTNEFLLPSDWCKFHEINFFKSVNTCSAGSELLLDEYEHFPLFFVFRCTSALHKAMRIKIEWCGWSNTHLSTSWRNIKQYGECPKESLKSRDQYWLTFSNIDLNAIHSLGTFIPSRAAIWYKAIRNLRDSIFGNPL